MVSGLCWSAREKIPGNSGNISADPVTQKPINSTNKEHAETEKVGMIGVTKVDAQGDLIARGCPRSTLEPRRTYIFLPQ